MKKLFLVALLLMALLVGGIACVSAPKMVLPEGAIQLSEVVPAMGEHWADMTQLGPQVEGSVLIGPVFVVYKGEVIGQEYIWRSGDRIPTAAVPTPEGEMILGALPSLPVGVTVEFVEVAFFPEGMEEFDFPLWTLHLYFIPKAVVDAIMPGG